MTHVLDALGRIKEYWGSVALADLDDYAQGRMIRGGAVDWETFSPGGVGWAIVSTATVPEFEATPAWTGRHTFDAGIVIGAGQGITMVDDTWIGIGAAQERIVFDAAGDISVMGAHLGLGTLIPNYLAENATVLSILGPAQNQPATIELVSPDVTAANVIGKIEFLNLDGGAGVVSRSTIACARDGADDASLLDFYTEATGVGVSKKMTILGNGNVGIGGTPTVVLHAFDSIATTRIKLENTTAVAVGNTAGFDFACLTTVQGRTAFLMQANWQDTADATRTSRAYFYTWANAVTQNTLVLDGANVGVGAVPNTNHKLEVYKTGAASNELGIILAAGAGNEECIINFGDSLVGAARYQGRIYYRHADNTMRFWTNASASDALIIDVNSHVYPGTNKAQDLGLAGSRWREIFCSLALNTGTSRLVPVQKNCAVDGTQLVRSTGGLRVLGEESDWLLAFCPTCGTVAMEELRHRTSPITKPAPKVVLTGMEVLKHSGNTKSVVVNFRYGDDVEGEMGVRKAPHNSTTLSDDELAAFLGMTDDKERRAFLLELGQIEWNALEKMEVIGPELDDEQVRIDALIRELIGIDLSKEAVRVN